MLPFPSSSYKFHVNSYQSDQNGKLTLPSLFHFLQECAWDNARLNNFGYEYLDSCNAFWVLSRIIVQMDAYPKWKDEIEIKTWPKGADGLFALRDFEIYFNDRVIGRATSSWLILDQNTRRPLKLDNFDFINEDYLKEGAMNQKPDKILFKGELNEIEKRKVHYSDLDVNKHVNNASYVKWILDSYYSEHKKDIFEFNINFISELMMGDEFSISALTKEQNLFYVLNNDKGKEVCRASIR